MGLLSIRYVTVHPIIRDTACQEIFLRAENFMKRATSGWVWLYEKMGSFLNDGSILLTEFALGAEEYRMSLYMPGMNNVFIAHALDGNVFGKGVRFGNRQIVFLQTVDMHHYGFVHVSLGFLAR